MLSINRLFGRILLSSAAAVLGSGLSASNASANVYTSLVVKLNGAGATFPKPLYQKWISDYVKLNPEIQVDYEAKGSGAGIAGITDKTVDFAGSDAPLSKTEATKINAEMVQLPVIAGAAVLIYNVPGLSSDLNLSGEVVADIYLGKITKWNAPKIAALNSGVTLPDVDVVPVARQDSSGTTFVFTSYLATQSEAYKSTLGVGKTVKWPSARLGSKSDGVVQIVKENPGTIGYAELNYATSAKLPYANIKNQSGKFVKATPETITAAGTAAVAEMSKTLTVNIWNQPGDESYPISAFTYLIVYKDLGYLKDEAKARELVRFFKWALTEGQASAASLDYAPLSPAVREKVLAGVESLTWNGKSAMSLVQDK